jgi:hypothetical protein
MSERKFAEVTQTHLLVVGMIQKHVAGILGISPNAEEINVMSGNKRRLRQWKNIPGRRTLQMIVLISMSLIIVNASSIIAFLDLYRTSTQIIKIAVSGARLCQAYTSIPLSTAILFSKILRRLDTDITYNEAEQEQILMENLANLQYLSLLSEDLLGTGLWRQPMCEVVRKNFGGTFGTLCMNSNTAKVDQSILEAALSGAQYLKTTLGRMVSDEVSRQELEEFVLSIDFLRLDERLFFVQRSVRVISEQYYAFIRQRFDESSSMSWSPVMFISSMGVFLGAYLLIWLPAKYTRWLYIQNTILSFSNQILASGPFKQLTK